MTACGTTAAAGGLREQILSAAQACFHKRGFKATTMNAVARQAGMSVGNLYNYFGGKDAIIDEIAQREVARLAAEVDAVVNGRMPIGEQREQLFRTLCSQLSIERARVKVELFDEAAKNERIRTIITRSDEQLRELIKKMHRSRSDGTLTEEELETRVEMDIALCDGLSFRLIANSHLDKERIARAFADTIVR